MSTGARGRWKMAKDSKVIVKKLCHLFDCERLDILKTVSKMYDENIKLKRKYVALKNHIKGKRLKGRYKVGDVRKRYPRGMTGVIYFPRKYKGKWVTVIEK